LNTLPPSDGLEEDMKRILFATVGLVALAGPIGAAAAADLSQPPPAYPTKAPYLPSYYNWTGLYLGINGGGAWGSSTWSGLPSTFNTSGGMFGGQVGYNWQFGQFVYGLEGDIDWTDIHGASPIAACAVFACDTKNDFLSTVRGRVGFAADRFMPYVTGGLAIGNIRTNAPLVAGVDQTNAGWTVGGGVEFQVYGPWTAKVEYLFVDLGNANCGVPCGFAPGTNNVSLTSSVVRGGINYRF
jgi:outer membrane immunogenic protein